jgi:hypothetical protein
VNRTTHLFRSGLVTALALVSAPALANPIMGDVLIARQTPHTHHVQVTLCRDTAVGELEQPTAVTRDDDPLDPNWVEMDDSYETNTGSGLTDLDAMQFCDCDLEVGQHTWEVLLPGYDWVWSITLEVVEDQDDYEEIDPGPNPDPWDIPDPAEMQGIDCAAACDGTTDPDDEDEDIDAQVQGGWCAVLPAGASGFGLFLLLPLLVRRRSG